VITTLTLTDFRSYGTARLEPGTGPVVLHGPNGAGKTNLLEALSLLTPGKGLRGATAAEMGRREPGEASGRPWAVAVELDDDTRLGTGVPGGGAARRIVRINGETAQPGRLLEYQARLGHAGAGPAVFRCAGRPAALFRSAGVRRRARPCGRCGGL
jgi:DNA replication and repair protein RecF